MTHAGRNDPCPCGSGRKYKHCCESKKSGAFSSRIILLVVAGALLVGILAAVSNSRSGSDSRQVWSAEHGHYHNASGGEMPR
jgi:hypothetical protein